MRRHGGFTMIEMMFVIVVIGILTTVAVVAYTRVMRKARSTEVVQMFAELKSREEAYHAEFGSYLPACPAPTGTAGKDCAEGAYWPATLPGRGELMDATSPPARWQALRVQIPKAGLYCQYEVVAGPGGDNTPMGPIGIGVYGSTAPLRGWFYVLAQCDWDSDSTVNAMYWQRHDSTELGRDNEQR